MVGLDALIEPTHLTVGFVAKCIDGKDEKWDRLRSTGDFEDIKLQPISGNGYLSTINRVSFYFSGENALFSVILKVPSTATFDGIVEEDAKTSGKEANEVAKEMGDMSSQFAEFHNKEILFYEQVGSKATHLHLPKIYAARKCEPGADMASSFIIMEDLDGKGDLANVGMGLTKGQIESCIAAIADFHAYSLTLPKSLVEQFVAPRFEGHYAEFAEMVMRKLLATDSEYVHKNENALRKFVRSAPPPENFVGHEHFGTPPVLCHGDLWMNNVFFKKDSAGKLTDDLCSFLDWQVAHADTGLNDLGHLILVGASHILKGRHLEYWLKLYYDKFSAATKRYGVENAYTLDLVRQMFDYHYQCELGFAVMVIALSLEKATCDEERKSLLERLESCFEVVRKDYE